MTKYISFSVYGPKRTYQVGALKNADLIKNLYPGWQAIFYVDKLLGAEFVEELARLGARVVIRDLNLTPHGMFWRFEAASLPDAEAVIFRDTDSRLSTRESLAVQEWDSSGFDLHVMRDHPFHSFWILGGMWGAKGELLSRIGQALPQSISEAPRWGLDQEWLASSVYKPNANNVLVHDSFFNRDHSALFPSRRLDGEYVGESVDDQGFCTSQLRDLVSKAESNPFYAKKLLVRDWLRVRMEQKL